MGIAILCLVSATQKTWRREENIPIEFMQIFDIAYFRHVYTRILGYLIDMAVVFLSDHEITNLRKIIRFKQLFHTTTHGS